MATPDTSLLTSSAQIFSSNHTLPQIRAIHKALHVQIDDKAARLRTQVGGSYRELLGTADTIVQMRNDMDTVQGTLGRMGGRCGRAVVGGKVAGLAKFVREQTGAETELGLVAQARLLEACALTVERILRGPGGGVGDEGSKVNRGGRLVVAAKVLVLSRLLVNSLGEDISDAGISVSVEASKKSLTSLRRKLLRAINKVLGLVSDTSDREDVLKALCAYSLATSSGARDVIGHFLKMRAQAMAPALEVEEGERERSAKHVLKSLGLYTKTLLDVQALVPNKLMDALADLKRDALLTDKTLRRSESLRLDIYEQWCGEDIQYFKPYIRHDDLDGQQAKEMLSSWATEGSKVLMQGLEKTLERLFDFKSIVDMRTSVLQLWIRDGGKARGFDPSLMLEKLRGAINRHMLQVLNMKVSKLRLVGSEVAAALEAWQDGITDKQRSLWDDSDDFDMDVSNGAAQFTQDVVARLYGRNDAVSKAVTCYQSWYHVIDDVAQVVEQLRRQRWDNDIDEIEDEETIEYRQQLLSRDDPQTLHNRLDAALEKAFRELDKQLATEWDASKDGAKNGQISTYFVRVLRDIRSKLPKLKAVEDFGLALVPSLHERMVATVTVSPLGEFSAATLMRRTVVGRNLWEGEPELPTSPSPSTFRFLRSLTVSMGDAGMDLWSPPLSWY